MLRVLIGCLEVLNKDHAEARELAVNSGEGVVCEGGEWHADVVAACIR